MTRFSFAAMLASAVVLSSCSVMAIKKHEPNFKNVRALEQVKGKYHVVEVKAKDATMVDKLKSDDLSCRLTTFNMPAGKTVSAFIQDALTDELDAARKLDPKGSSIAIVVNQIDSDSASFNKGSWSLDFDYLVNNKTVNVKTKTEFESAYMADTACRNTANALTDALAENFTSFYKKLSR